MHTSIDIKFRKERFGPELDLVKNFLKDFKDFFNPQGLEVTPLIEPYAEAGIPDILLIVWDKNFCEAWHPTRHRLTKNDIKIVHYISTFGNRGVRIDKISSSLNFSPSILGRSIEKLMEAKLIEETDYRVSIRNLDESFFIRKIISIEAKISDWKNAIKQAELNENFSSHSYVLLPENKVNEKVISSFTGRTGLLAHNGEKTSFKKKAKKTKIPGSYFSWILNEYLGRQESQKMAIS